MSKPTEKEIEDKIGEALWWVMTSQPFATFYNSKSKKSLDAHIRGEIGAPTKEEMKEKMKHPFCHLYASVKEIVNAC